MWTAQNFCIIYYIKLRTRHQLCYTFVQLYMFLVCDHSGQYFFFFFSSLKHINPPWFKVYLPCLYILMTEAMLNFKECKFHVQSSFFFTQCYLTSCTMFKKKKKDLKVISYLQFCVLCLHVRKGCWNDLVYLYVEHFRAFERLI